MLRYFTQHCTDTMESLQKARRVLLRYPHPPLSLSLSVVAAIWCLCCSGNRDCRRKEEERGRLFVALTATVIQKASQLHCVFEEKQKILVAVRLFLSMSKSGTIFSLKLH